MNDEIPTKAKHGGKRAGAGRPNTSRPPVVPRLVLPVTKQRKAKALAAQRRVAAAFANVSVRNADEETVEVLAQTYTLLAIETLAEIALAGDKDAARVAAANALLTRGHGPPKPAGGLTKKDLVNEPSEPMDVWDKLLGSRG